MDRLASTKQVLDLKNIIRGPFSLILLICLSVSAYFVCFLVHFHDFEGMKKTRNAIWSRSVQEFWRELCSGPVWWRKRCSANIDGYLRDGER